MPPFIISFLLSPAPNVPRGMSLGLKVSALHLFTFHIEVPLPEPPLVDVGGYNYNDFI